MMERKKISKACGSKSGQVVEIRRSSGCSVTNLPSHILADILLRLPIKQISVCKCVSKSFDAKISNPDFAQSDEVFPIARKLDNTHVSRILYPLEIDQDGKSMDMFLIPAPDCPHLFEHLHVRMEFDTKLKIPLRNFPMDTVDCNEKFILEAKDHGYTIVNSCNGFLCLSEPVHVNPVVVCNPFTGEFINLPRVISNSTFVGYEEYIVCGFGYSPKTNQYKVVRILDRDLPPGCDEITRSEAQVHILGTTSWKNIESVPIPGPRLEFPTYLNGAVHWFCHFHKKLSHMVSFDCEKERFLPFPLPPLTDPNRNNVGMGVLEGCLCICDSSKLTSISVWLMKNYGVEKSWTRLFEIDMSHSDELLYGLYQPIKYLNNGALLMFNYPRCFLVYYDPRKPDPSSKRHDMLLLEIGATGSMVEIVPHTPSFTSLKNVLAGCNVEVLNVYSRCAGLKIKGEGRKGRSIGLCEKTDFFHTMTLPYFDRVASEYSTHNNYLKKYHCEEYWWGKYEYEFSKIWRGT